MHVVSGVGLVAGQVGCVPGRRNDGDHAQGARPDRAGNDLRPGVDAGRLAPCDVVGDDAAGLRGGARCHDTWGVHGHFGSQGMD